MKVLDIHIVSIGAKHFMRRDNSESEDGASLLEFTAALLILTIMTVVTIPRLQNQLAVREIETIARRFISHAHFARNLALRLGETVSINPKESHRWDSGWVINSVCRSHPTEGECTAKTWFSQGEIAPIYFKGAGKGFHDPHTKQKGITFNPAGAAKTEQGGFVANRLILGHIHHPELERQLILSSGGRWRLCDPKTDSRGCQ